MIGVLARCTVLGEALLEGALFTALERFAGTDLGVLLDHPDGLAGLANEQGRHAVAWVSSRKMGERMALRGFTRMRTFAVLPSPNRVRWLLPEGSRHVSLAALQVYAPYSPAARLLKCVLSFVIRAGWQGWVRHKVTLGSWEALPLEDLVAELSGEPDPVFALSLGTPTSFRKLTIQVMRPSGQILGYIKLPLTQAAIEHLRHEAEILQRLSEFNSLNPYIPKVLHASEWDDGYILFLSAGPMSPGPVEYERLHEDFLSHLRSIHQLIKPGHVLLEEVAARWHKAETLLDSKWRTLGEAALARAKRELDGRTVRCGVAHGDFTPWNTHVGEGRLYVFDWESASWEAPTSWDTFHFKTQVASLLNKKCDMHIPWDCRSDERASFLLYLLNSACELSGEESPDLGVALEYRRQLLAKLLERYSDHGLVVKCLARVTKKATPSEVGDT